MIPRNNNFKIIYAIYGKNMCYLIGINIGIITKMNPCKNYNLLIKRYLDHYKEGNKKKEDNNIWRNLFSKSF